MPIMRSLVAFLLVALASACSPANDQSPAKIGTPIDELRAGFQSPPNEARPRTWWHWLNGNITKSGIEADLEWMHRVGLRGIQVFDANLNTPVIVENRLPFMSEEWKEHFKFAIEKAESLDFEVAIAGAPGWSQMGGPWVSPEDGMKKLVWSELTLQDGTAFNGTLPPLPTETGPYQSLKVKDDLVMAKKTEEPPTFSKPVAVLAFPIQGQEETPNKIYSTTAAIENSELLGDDDYTSAAKLFASNDDTPADLIFEYDAPVSIRSATLFLPDGRPPFREPPYLPELQVEKSGAWHSIAEFPIYDAPTTIGFEEVTATRFRLVFSANPAKPESIGGGAEGAVRFDIFGSGGDGSIGVGAFTVSSVDRVHLSEVRSGLAIEEGINALPSAVPSSARSISKSDIVNLTSMVSEAGVLGWTPPDERNWRIMRIGYSLTGKTNHPASPDATGLEVDKYDREAVERYLDTYAGMYRDTVGPDFMGARGLSAFLSDSIEVDASNWTEDMPAKFHELRGYELNAYLPVLAGYVVGSKSETEAFLQDWLWSLEDLLAREYYQTVGEFADSNDLTLYGEALEVGRPVYGDDIQMREFSDVPMAALWTWAKDGHAQPAHIGDMRSAASVANIYGKDYVAAESMTSMFAPWAFAPSDLKRVVDFEFANGINRIVIHTSVHQPLDDFSPGLSLAVFGQYFNRHETWADMAGPWIDYISRSSYLLQRGRTVADVAVFAGEDLPITQLYKAGGVPGDLPKDYGFDFVNAEIIEEILSVENGSLLPPGPARYRALQILDGARMRLSTLQSIADLKAAGATLIGSPPDYAPSMSASEAEFKALIAELWDDVPSQNTDKTLSDLGISADFEGGDEDIHFLHRTDGTTDIYFISNQADTPKRFNASFRVTGTTPELWNALDGSMTAPTYTAEADRTLVQLELRSEQSIFVVFTSEASSSPLVASTENAYESLEITTPWEVTFQEGRGAPLSADFETLVPLNKNEDTGIKYFSGTAIYRTSVDVSAEIAVADKVWLDLGQVGDVAEVSINGKPVGTAWLAPFRIDISGHLTKGANELEVKVANVWVNRLVGDAQPGATKIAKLASPTYIPNAPLRDAGLIGPVSLVANSKQN